MKDGHYSRPVWADDSWLAKYAGKTLDEGNVGEHGELSSEHHNNIATIGKSCDPIGVTVLSYVSPSRYDYKTAQIS